MGKLRILRSSVELSQSSGPRPRINHFGARRPKNYLFWISVASVLVVAVGGRPSPAAYGQVGGKLGNSSDTQNVIPAESNLAVGMEGTAVQNTAARRALAGLKIVQVDSNGAAARAGLKYGDVLIAYNNRPVTTQEAFEAVIRLFNQPRDQAGKQATAQLSFYRGGGMTVETMSVPMGRLGVDIREWTLSGALVEDAIVIHNDYLAAQKYADDAAASGHYTDDQVLHMRMLCLNNEKDSDNLRQMQVQQLYQRYLPQKLMLFANYDLLYNERYRAGAAIFEGYLDIKGIDVATELSLALCYIEIKKYDELDALLAKVLARPHDDRNAPTEFALSALLNIRARMYMGQRHYDRAQQYFQQALEKDPDDLYYALGFIYCAARRDISGEKAGAFNAAYMVVSARSEETEEIMNYHIDALRAFVLVKQRHISRAREIAEKWKDSDEVTRQILSFWRRFPDGSEIIENWNSLLDRELVASFVSPVSKRR